MLNVMYVFSIIFVLSIFLLVLEFFLARKQKKSAVVLPVIVLCTSIILGLFSLIVSACMFAIFIMVGYLQKKDEERSKDVSKMNIQDL